MAGSGEMLIVGGDLTIAGKRNFSNQQTTIFRPNTNQISATVQMRYARWYPTVVALPTGEMLVLGGRQDKNPTPASTPEASTGYGVADADGRHERRRFRHRGGSLVLSKRRPRAER
jgi:hypothetical protein